MTETKKTSLSNLNDYLFGQLGRLDASKLKQEEIELEVKRTNAIVHISEQIINNAHVALDGAKLVAKHGIGNWENMLPDIEGKPSRAAIPDYKNNKLIK